MNNKNEYGINSLWKILVDRNTWLLRGAKCSRFQGFLVPRGISMSFSYTVCLGPGLIILVLPTTSFYIPPVPSTPNVLAVPELVPELVDMPPVPESAGSTNAFGVPESACSTDISCVPESAGPTNMSGLPESAGSAVVFCDP